MFLRLATRTVSVLVAVLERSLLPPSPDRELAPVFAPEFIVLF